MSSEIKADKWSPASGTSATLGDSGDTFTIPSGEPLQIVELLRVLHLLLHQIIYNIFL